MIGPRSALFTPFNNLGLIIIDEEHEGAYKSDSVPKYHARDVAIKRAELTGAAVVLGSATPSVSTYYKAQKGEYELYKLEKRANNLSLPDVDIVDMRQELESGNKDIFSNRLKSLIADRLNKKEQIMLFINRRGYSSFVSCRKCGKSIKCPHCDVTLTLHRRRGGDVLSCHYCGYQIDSPKTCPVCQSKYIGKFGTGTEKVAERIEEEFKGVRVLRMDMDTTREKGSYESILSEFESGSADVLVGTQMIVKGHDFSNVTLVGIIAAERMGADRSEQEPVLAKSIGNDTVRIGQRVFLHQNTGHGVGRDRVAIDFPVILVLVVDLGAEREHRKSGGKQEHEQLFCDFHRFHLYYNLYYFQTIKRLVSAAGNPRQDNHCQDWSPG